jgi:hypothetical protein
MPVRWEAVILRIIIEAGLLPPDFRSPENCEKQIEG